MSIQIPEQYQSALSIRETEVAIKTVKDFFERTLAENLNLTRVSAPLFVPPETGLNDDLNGVERPVSFGIREQGERKIEIVHSLAKWKRHALKRYEFQHGEGLYTDMNAIRRDEDTDNIHSIFVDQWDWEKIIAKEERNEETLKKVVNQVYRRLYVKPVSVHKEITASGHSFHNDFRTGTALSRTYAEGEGVSGGERVWRYFPYADRGQAAKWRAA